jgi:K+-sensing histidine kinase KdpD
MAMTSSEQPNDSPAVAWPDIVRFVRQLGHDIRNNLNAAELQSAYLAELAESAEMKSEVQRLREIISQTGVGLQRLTAALGQVTPTLIAYRAEHLMDDLQKKIGKEFSDKADKITWNVQVKNESLQIDPQLLQQALLELLTNAFQHERNVTAITVKTSIDNGRFVFELREPKARFEGSTDNWGRQPLRKVSQGHYGLGLNQVRLILNAHGGDLRAEYDRPSSTLVTTVTLPISRDSST